MNLSPKIESQYIDYSAPTIEQRIDGVVSQLSRETTILSISVFGATSNENYHHELQLIKSAIAKHLSYLPLVTYIAQPLPDEQAIAMEVYYINMLLPQVVELANGVRYLKLNLCDRELCFVEGIAAESFYDSVQEQSREIFSKITELFAALELRPSNIIRQWNYIGHITAVNHGMQHYQAFNDARSEFYATDSWALGYPAATGIGTSCDGVVVSLIACGGDVGDYCCSIDNPLQIAAHAYNKHLLIGEEQAPKTTPKFERAKSICFTNDSYCFISGTAAIRGEESLFGADAKEQTIKTIENIEYLISDKNMATHSSQARHLKPVALRVYVKHRADFDVIKEVVSNHWGDTPQIYVEADVCRSELLVEIEGVAKGGVL